MIPFQIENSEGGLFCPNGTCICQNVANGKLVGDSICCTPNGTELPPNDDETTAEKDAQCPSNQQCLAICFFDYPGVSNYCCMSFPYSTTTTATPPPPPGPSCSPSTARVNLQNGKSVTMSELQIGDHVQAGKQHFYFIISFLLCCWDNSKAFHYLMKQCGNCIHYSIHYLNYLATPISLGRSSHYAPGVIKHLLF